MTGGKTSITKSENSGCSLKPGGQKGGKEEEKKDNERWEKKDSSQSLEMGMFFFKPGGQGRGKLKQEI